MPGAGGEKPLLTDAPGSLVAWATDAFAALHLTWRDAPAKAPAVRVLGKTADERALMDLTIKRDKIIGASAVVPIKAEYTPMLVFLLAALVSGATLPEADQWLARQLRRLPKNRVGDIAAPWHQWRVALATNSYGLLTMQVKR